jgi:hypothetical protein
MSNSPSKQPASPVPLPVSTKGNQLAIAGLVISTIGFVGWLVMLALIFSIHQEDSIHGSNNPLIELNNFLNYLLQVAVGVVGMSINGTLSIIGAVISLSARGQTTSSKATTGLLLGIAGQSIGTVLILWRMSAWGVFGA